MRRKTIPVKNGALVMIAAGREDEADLLKERSMAGVPCSPILQLHADASTTQGRIDRSVEQGDAEDGVRIEHRYPSGFLKAAAVGVLIGIAAAKLYQWCMERQRQDDLAWEYYRTH